MKIFECKCGSKEIFIKENGNNKGLYCAECGKWIQWLGKDDLRLAERQIEQSIINPIPRNLDELKEHDKQIRAEAISDYANKLLCLASNKCKFIVTEEYTYYAMEQEDIDKLIYETAEIVTHYNWCPRYREDDFKMELVKEGKEQSNKQYLCPGGYDKRTMSCDECEIPFCDYR